MSSQTLLPAPPRRADSSTAQPQFDELWPLSVTQYHQMIEAGILKPGDPVELLEGYLVRNVPQNPDLFTTTDELRDALGAVIPEGWHVRSQGPLTLARSEPEPDAAVVRGRRSDFRTRHPGPAETGLVAEVADSSLHRDREQKRPVYAAAKIPACWIVNLVSRTVEVYSTPAGEGDDADYQTRIVHGLGDSIAVVLDGLEVGRIPVSALFPTPATS